MNIIFSITKREALDIYRKPGLLAKALGITCGAVSQWPLDSAIPEAQALKIRYVLHPDLFEKKAAG